MADKFEYEIVEKFGTLSDKNGWTKELNFISYNNAAPKYDLRTWNIDEEGNQKMSKGVTLDKSEIKKLKEILDNIDLD